jgi:hypothetical protein
MMSRCREGAVNSRSRAACTASSINELGLIEDPSLPGRWPVPSTLPEPPGARNVAVGFLFQGLVLLDECPNLGLESFRVMSEPGHEGADLAWVETAEPHSEILAAYVFCRLVCVRGGSVLLIVTCPPLLPVSPRCRLTRCLEESRTARGESTRQESRQP